MLKRIRKFFAIIKSYLVPDDKELNNADVEMRRVFHVDTGKMTEEEVRDGIMSIKSEIETREKPKCKPECDCTCKKGKRGKPRRSRSGPRSRTHRGTKAGTKR